MRPIIALIPFAFCLPACLLADPQVSPPAAAPYVAHTAEIPTNENKVVCVAGDTLHLTGHYTNPGFAQVLLISDRRTVAAVDTGVGMGDAADFSFKWTPADVGLHRVKIVGQAEHAGQTTLRVMTVRVIADAPGGLSALPASSLTDVPVRIMMHGQDFVPVRAAFNFAGKSVPCGGDGVSALLPVSAQPSGVYTCACQAWDSDGEMLDVGTGALSVTDRIGLTSPGTFTLSTPTDRLPLSVDVKPGIAVKSVTYSLDGQSLVTATAAPFSGAADMSAFTTGSRTLKAHVVMSDGNEFDSSALAIAFKNQIQDDKNAADAKLEADREAAVAIAQARAAAAAEAAKDAGPTGPARKLLRAYFQTHPELQMTLQDVSDVRKSDSEVYPSDIYALVMEPGLDLQRIVFSVNMASQTVSTMIKKW